MKILGKPAFILINVAIAAIVGAFGYNFKHKASVASEFQDGPFGSFTKAAMEQNDSNGNICIIVALVFLSLAVYGIIIYSNKKSTKNEGDQPQ